MPDHLNETYEQREARWADVRERMNRPCEQFVVRSETHTCAKHGDYERHRMGIRPLSPLPRGDFALDLSEFLASWTNCPTCNAAMQIEADNRDAEIRSGATQREVLFRQKMDLSGIPARHRDCTIWNWTHGPEAMRTAWSSIRDYVTSIRTAIETGRSIVICGSTGAGKTHIAVGVLRHVLEHGGTGRYTTLMDILGRIKDTYNQSAKETETGVLDELCRVDMLVIDEIGKQLDSNYEHAQFFRILDRRYRDMKPVLLISNMPRQKFTDFVGGAVIDRLREAGGLLLSFDWASHRNHKPKRKGDDDGQ